MPLQWGCSNCDAKNTDASVNNFRASCKHIICEQCVLAAVNRNKLLTRKTYERKASSASVIDVTCPCVRCRGTVQVSQSWYEDMNARVISLCNDDKDGHEAVHSTAAVASVKTEVKTDVNAKSECDDQQQLVASGIERGGLKPLFEKGDAVYALWEESGTWHPGKILSYKQIDSKSIYGDVRKYVVKFDDGDVGSTDDYNVFLAEDYLLHLKDEDEWKWKGVEKKTDKRSSDEWARVVGWYVANIDGEKQKFSTLVGALRAYDASVLKKMKNEDINKCELNLPQEHRETSPNKEGSDVNVVTPLKLPPLLLNNAEEEYDDDDESRFSDIEMEQGEAKRIKIDKRTKITLPPHIDGLRLGEKFWSAGHGDIEFTKVAFKKKSIFHLNSLVETSMKDNGGFGPFVEHGIATPNFDEMPRDIVNMIPELSQNELRDALIQYTSWGHQFENKRISRAGQAAMWWKRVEIGSFVVMRHEYKTCRFCPDWLKERDDKTGALEYKGPVYIIGVVTRKIKPFSAEEEYVHSQISMHSNEYDSIPNIYLVDWKRIGFKNNLEEKTQKYINSVCQPTVANICNHFNKIYKNGTTAESIRQDLWNNSIPFVLQ